MAKYPLSNNSTVFDYSLTSWPILNIPYHIWYHSTPDEIMKYQPNPKLLNHISEHKTDL